MQSVSSRVSPNAERFKSIPYEVPLSLDAYADTKVAHYGFATELLSKANIF